MAVLDLRRNHHVAGGRRTRRIVGVVILFFHFALLAAVPPSPALAKVTLDGPGKTFFSDLKKAVKGKSSLNMSQINVLKDLPVVVDVDLSGIQLKNFKIVDNCLLAETKIQGRKAKFLVFPTTSPAGKTVWNVAGQIEKLDFKKIVTDMGAHLDQIAPKRNTLVFASATADYAKKDLPKPAQDMFKGMFVKGPVIDAKGTIPLVSGLTYLGLLTPASENDTLKRIRKLVGFKTNTALITGKLQLGFIQQLFAGKKPDTKNVDGEFSILFPPIKPRLMPKWVGMSNLKVGAYGNNKKMFTYAVAQTPLTIDNKGNQLLFAGVVTLGKGAAVSSSQMVRAWEVSLDTDDPDQEKEYEAKFQADDAGNAESPSERDRRDQQNSVDAERTFNRYSQSNRNRGNSGTATAAQERVIKKTAKPQFTLYAESLKPWKDVLGVKLFDIDNARFKLTVYKEKEMSIGFYGEIAVDKKPVKFGNNWFIKSIPTPVKYIPIPAIYAWTDGIAGTEIIHYCKLAADILRIKENCPADASGIVKKTAMKNTMLKIVPPLADEKDLELSTGIAVAADLYYDKKEIGGIFGEYTPEGTSVTGYKTAFTFGPIDMDDVAVTYTSSNLEGIVYAFEGGAKVLGAEQHVAARMSSSQVTGAAHANYFNEFEADISFRRRYEKVASMSVQTGYDYAASLRADFKGKLAGMVLSDPVLKPLLQEFAKARKIAGPALQWTPVKDLHAALKQLIVELRKVKAEVKKVRGEFKAKLELEVKRIEALIKEVENLTRLPDKVFAKIDPDPKKMKDMAIKAIDATAEKLGIPDSLHARLGEYGDALKIAQKFKDKFKIETALELEGKFPTVTWKEPTVKCGDVMRAAIYPIKASKCSITLVSRSFDDRPPDFDEAMDALNKAEALHAKLEKDIPKILKTAYKKSMDRVRAEAKALKLKINGARTRLAELIEFMKTMAKYLAYVDDLKKLEPHLAEYPRLIAYIEKHKFPLPFKQQHIKIAPKFAPYIGGEQSVEGMNSGLDKELKQYEPVLKRIISDLELASDAIATVADEGGKVTVAGAKLSTQNAYDEYKKVVGDSLSTSGRLEWAMGKYRLLEKGFLGLIVKANDAARHNVLVDEINELIAGYKNQDSLFIIRRAETEGVLLHSYKPVKGTVIFDVSMAGVGWAGRVGWDFTKGIQQVFDSLKIELKNYLDEETA